MYPCLNVCVQELAQGHPFAGDESGSVIGRGSEGSLIYTAPLAVTGKGRG